MSTVSPFDVAHDLVYHTNCNSLLLYREGVHQGTYQRQNRVGIDGGVYLHLNTQTDHQIIVKEVTPSDPEVAIASLLEHNAHCNVVAVRSISSDHTHGDKRKRYVVMERMDGDLDGLTSELAKERQRLTNPEIIRVVQQLHTQLLCLSTLVHTNPLYYTDLKMPNVLYRANKKTGLAVRLGDLGSAGTGRRGYVTSLPFWYMGKMWQDDRNYNWINNAEDARACVVYQLAHLVWCLLGKGYIEAGDEVARASAAATLYREFPGEPYDDWLLLRPGVVDSFWQGSTPTPRPTSDGPVRLKRPCPTADQPLAPRRRVTPYDLQMSASVFDPQNRLLQVTSRRDSHGIHGYHRGRFRLRRLEKGMGLNLHCKR
jgi:serine/threonine protein kinase